MKAVGLIVLVAVAFIGGFLAGEKMSAQKAKAQVVKAQGDADIYRAESERLSSVLREIRQSASEATVVEKAQ